jgi:ribosomal 50S subunit-recycling heat shock protein
MRKTGLAIVVAVLFAGLACSLGGINFRDDGVQVTMSISEEQLNNGEFRLNAGDLFSGAYQIDLQPGKIVITGTLVQPNGTEVAGNAEIGISAANGSLQVTILAVNAQGISLNDDRVQQIQDAVTQAISQAFSEQELVFIESIVITDQNMDITVRVKLQ